ncbi:MAG: hypothetical protein A3A43_01155 [Candidatus Liptonbacteria bacterium RIFCSPLOWO2_01_FULL_56_20]|uniref:GIY-YIG domain-containing protein n=1 Tax=Candidatus Liptonbacteria bacterium RIFCSPLOWO2_01_FULL_56_20 TaxID=1798652 RepID=A0A1G2CJI5_9BACT|nr:MAG: hypothetical protein A3A43_01155 [Candidatus Liptonbacteria bacterium RIFCSPLOWO2_01_FULL_56_20]
MVGFVYILKGSGGEFYVGSTTNLERRLKQHAYGHTQTTVRMKNPEVALIQKYPSLGTARKVERRLKRMKRKDFLEKMIIDGYIRIKA